MPCTTLLAGRNATNDHSTMIARTEDGFYDVKKMIVVMPEDQPKVYKSVLSKVEIPLPENPMRYTSCPNVDPKEGIWAATGINAANVGMTATETITSNPRVLAADPLTRRIDEEGNDKPAGIGEEDLVVLVLPYVHSAREAALRLGALVEEYGTYESNGIAFNDENECWWLETIGGHHWMAKKVPDNMVVIAPNQFAMDSFDFDDAFGEKKEHLCSSDLLEFIDKYHLNLNRGEKFNPRFCFGSIDDSDHIYNTPRAWYMGRCLCPFSHTWDGENAEFKPESDNIPWALVPDKKVTVEDVIYIMSSNFQGTPYDPYSAQNTGKNRIYRSIGISRTGVTSVCQIRSDVPDEIKGIEWVSFGSNAFNSFMPLYSNVDHLPDYLTNVTKDVSTDNFYWNSRLLGSLADPHYGTCIPHIERYKARVLTQGRRLMHEYDSKILDGEGGTSEVSETELKSEVTALLEEANQKISDMVQKATGECLIKVLHDATVHMKNTYNRSEH